MNEVKAGVKTTEFWIVAVLVIIQYVLGSGAVETDVAIKIMTAVIAGLGAIGYTVSRAMVKVAASKR